MVRRLGRINRREGYIRRKEEWTGEKNVKEGNICRRTRWKVGYNGQKNRIGTKE